MTLIATLLAACTATNGDHTPPMDSTAAGSVTITGTVTNEGVECPAVRTSDNQLYTIATNDRSKLRPGTRVRITGTIAEMSFCQQGTTISADSIEVLSGS